MIITLTAFDGVEYGTADIAEGLYPSVIIWKGKAFTPAPGENAYQQESVNFLADDDVTGPITP
jgi:hypothetical protein